MTPPFLPNFPYIDQNNMHGHIAMLPYDKTNGYWSQILGEDMTLLKTDWNFKYLGTDGNCWAVFFDFNLEPPNHVIFFSNCAYGGSGDKNDMNNYYFNNTENIIHVWDGSGSTTDIQILNNNFDPNNAPTFPPISITDH